MNAPADFMGHRARYRGLSDRLAEAEDMARDKDARLRSVVKAAGVAIIGLSGDIVTDWNDSATEITSVPAAMAIGKSLSDLLKEKRFFGVLKRVNDTPFGIEREFETQIDTTDGPRLVLWRLTTARDSAGREWGRVLVGEDVTNLKTVEAQLWVSRERYRSVIDTQTELICRLDLKGNLVFVNDAYCRTFGQDRETLVGKSYSPLIHPEDRERVANTIASVNEKNPQVTLRQRVILPTTGELRSQEWTSTAILDATGRMIELQASGRDVTDEVTAQEQANRRASKLKALSALNVLISGTLDTDSIFQTMAIATATLVDAKVASIWTVDHERRVLVREAFSDPQVALDFPEEEIAFSDTVARHSIETGLPFQFVGDEQLDNEKGPGVVREWWRKHGIKHVCLYPVVGEGRVVAIIAALRQEERRLDDVERDVIGSVAAQASAALRMATQFSDMADLSRSYAGSEMLAALDRLLAEKGEHAPEWDAIHVAAGEAEASLTIRRTRQ